MAITQENAFRLLADLVALPSANPMGRPYDGHQPVERQIVDYVRAFFSRFGVDMSQEACSPEHESLEVRIPGRSSAPATLFEAHMDTVPADEWSERAFAPRRDGNLLVGLGACDVKGGLVAMLLALEDLLESGTPPPQPLVFLAAGDEEFAQTGIKHFRQTCVRSFGRGVFAEPTELRPIVQHKGTIRWDITVQGQSAHSARPELGRNAIADMTRVIRALARYEEDLQRTHRSPLMTGPTATVTMIRGGRTRNAVPDECTVALDLRVIPGMDPAASRDGVVAALAELDLPIVHHDVQLATPALATSADDPFVEAVVEVCGRILGEPVQPEGVPYGTDAAWMPEGTPAIVLGPGDIRYAHAVDERIDIRDVVRCAQVFRELALRDWCAGPGSATKKGAEPR